MKFKAKGKKELNRKIVIERAKHILRSEYLWILGVAVILFLGVCFKLSDFIYAVTALIILFYTVETYKMRKEIVEQTKLQLAPFLTMEFEQRSSLHFLLIINRGEATARNIETECLPFPDWFGPFVKISTLGKDEGKSLRYESKDSHSVIGEATLNDFRKETTFRIKYENIFGKGYESKVVLKESGLFFLSEFKVVI